MAIQFNCARPVGTRFVAISPPRSATFVTFAQPGDEARIKGTTYTATVVDAPNVSNNSVYRYDANGYLNSVAVNDERARTLTYATDAAGQILSRVEDEWHHNRGNPRQMYFYFDGIRVGEIGNNGPVETD